jgi:alkylation response protein AidB-like acyl-CoA dehydrogenase
LQAVGEIAAAASAAEAQLITERLTMTAAQRLFDTGGASATARTLNLDRHWRNARTVATHSPLDYKSYAAGDFAVNGASPPANGYF